MNKYERSNPNRQISIIGQKNLQENECTRFNVIENVPSFVKYISDLVFRTFLHLLHYAAKVSGGYLCGAEL